jgi:hypothetical protein
MESMHSKRGAFMSLINDLCKELSYPERNEELRDDEMLVMEMTLEGIAFTVSHSLNEHAEKILIQADFGPLPDERRTDVLYRIMHLNRELSEIGLAKIAYDAATGLVVYTHAAVLAELTGAILLTSMTEIAWRAEYWQSTYFLQTDGQRYPENLNEPFISLA